MWVQVGGECAAQCPIKLATVLASGPQGKAFGRMENIWRSCRKII